MSDTKPKREPKPTKRYLMGIRGALHVDAPNGEAAREAVRTWIEAAVQAAAAQDTSSSEEEPVVRVGWLRPHPED